MGERVLSDVYKYGVLIARLEYLALEYRIEGNTIEQDMLF